MYLRRGVSAVHTLIPNLRQALINRVTQCDITSRGKRQQYSKMSDAETKKATPSVYRTPAVEPPTLKKMEELAQKAGFDISDQDLQEYHAAVKNMLGVYNVIDSYPEPVPEMKYPRLPGYMPTKEENEYGAWYYKTDIKGADSGPLAGKTVAVKDNIAVGCVPMMNGTKVLEGYIPEYDATVVTKLLDAGATIKGKAANSCLLTDGCGYTCNKGPILNAHDKTRMAGGSSSGCGVLVALGEVDIGLAGDQGGSIRNPACWNGMTGIKPTFGLVSQTGSMGIEPSLDHIGPIAKTVYDCALCLEVIAGYDELDFRQNPSLTVPKYTQALTGDLTGMKVGIWEEGFKEVEADVDSLVKQAARALSAKGAAVEETSIPMHTDGLAIHLAINLEGGIKYIWENAGIHFGYYGYQHTTMIEHFNKHLRSRPNDLNPILKWAVLAGEYLKEATGNKFYAKAQNVRRTLTKVYDEALDKYDVLIMPTLPFKPPKLPPADIGPGEYIDKAINMVRNTAPFDITGHPAMSINAGWSEGLPVGMMIIGKRFHDSTVLKVGHAWETIRDAKGK